MEVGALWFAVQALYNCKMMVLHHLDDCVLQACDLAIIQGFCAGAFKAAHQPVRVCSALIDNEDRDQHQQGAAPAVGLPTRPHPPSFALFSITSQRGDRTRTR